MSTASSSSSATSRLQPMVRKEAPKRVLCAAPVVAKDTSSSCGKVFAKPTKEWVIPERAKPGRKISAEEPDSKRQSQNRLSQRAHRARRTDYIQTLEERLRQYEANEVQSNVRLQEIARALKVDNDRLKVEVKELRDSIGVLQGEKEQWQGAEKGYKEEITKMSQIVQAANFSPKILPVLKPISYTSVAKKNQLVNSRAGSPAANGSSVSRNGGGLRRATLDCPICPNPDPDCPCQQPQPQSQPQSQQSSQSGSSKMATLTLAAKAIEDQEPIYPSSDCGVCTSTSECLCRAIDEADAVQPAPLNTAPVMEHLHAETTIITEDDDKCGLCTNSEFCACKTTSLTASPTDPGFESTFPSMAKTSMVAVPLRRRKRSADRPLAKLWHITSESTPAVKTIESCSGDPSNCQACKNDTFGQEFCSNLFSRKPSPAPVSTESKPCGNCAGSMSIDSLITHDTSVHHSRGSEVRDIEETMTADQAWKALKAHPNSRFASLSLLAEVVSRRSPANSTNSSPAPQSRASSVEVKVERNDIETDKSMPPPALPKRFEVQTSGVRDALKLLDRTSSPCASPTPCSKSVSASGSKRTAMEQGGEIRKRPRVDISLEN